MEFRAAQIEWSESVAILVGELDYSTGRLGAIAKPVSFTMEKYDAGFISEPTLQMDSGSARKLMDALWGAGVRPTDHKSTSAEVRRLEAHLEDMRKLVFKD